MRHARPDDLTAIEPLLDQLRSFDDLTERTPGSFYRKGKGFLHFHVDGAHLWCDVESWAPDRPDRAHDQSRAAVDWSRRCGGRSPPPDRSTKGAFADLPAD